MSKGNGENVEPEAPIVVMAPRDVPVGKLYGDGGARDTKRFLEGVGAVLQAQVCRSDQKRRASSGLIWGRRFGREWTSFCWTQHQRSSEAVTGHPQQLRREEECRVIPVGVHRSQQQPQEAVSAYGRRLRDAFEVVQARERDIGVTITSRRLLCEQFAE